jgi:N utilization substance protein B
LNNLPPIDLPELQPDDEINSEVIEHPEADNDSSLARQHALQALYEIDLSHHAIGDVINAQIAAYDRPVSRRAINYMQRLVTGVSQYRALIDSVISRFASEFPLNQIAAIDRNILRLAVFEFGIATHTPIAVAIDEAIELAKIFGAEGSARFVNGVLGSIAANPETLEVLRATATDSAADAANINGETV